MFRAQLKLVRRNKGESLTNLAMVNRRLMVMAFPGPTDRTTEIVDRDVFLDALDDPELTFLIHTQRPRDLDSAVQIAQYIEAVMRSIPCRSSKPVRAVVQSGNEGKIEAELRDLRAGQRHLLETLEQIGMRADTRTNQQPVADVKPSVTSPTTRTERRAPEGDGTKPSQRKRVCFACGNEGHYAKNCDQGRSNQGISGVRDRSTFPWFSFGPGAKEPPFSLPGEDSRRVYLEVLVNGNPTNCLLDTGSEVTLIPGSLMQELPKKSVTLQRRAANGTHIEVLGLVSLPVVLRGRQLLICGVASDHVGEMLLDSEWLEEEHAIWDMRSGELYMHGVMFPLKAKRDGG